MLPQRIANLVFAVAMLGACAFFAWMAKDFQAQGLGSSSSVGPRFFPMLTLVIMIICALGVIYDYAKNGESGGDKDEVVFDDWGSLARGGFMLIVAIGSYFLWINFGFIPMAILMGPLSLLAMGIRKPLYYITVSALAGLIYLAFTKLLNVQL